MNEQSWWQRLVAVIEREYERRIRRASLLGEFKPADADHHHAHGSAGSAFALPAHSEDEEAVIVNVPPGTRIGRSGASPDRQGDMP
ncbi:hypothetical protein [Chloroflexus sp.]|uniref:hypothetical protein n=1 Tax=Chloroflexus sp. TaxID=1904827 RepID=UPI00262D7452|nr:hypothetical protein [uncultured Chloroflexus sp.]